MATTTRRRRSIRQGRAADPPRPSPPMPASPPLPALPPSARPSRWERALDTGTAGTLLVTCFTFAVATAGLLRWLGTGGRGLLPPGLALAVIAASVLLAVVAVVARGGQMRVTLDHTRGVAPEARPSRMGLFPFVPTLLVVPIGVALLLFERYDGDGAIMAMIVAAFVSIGIHLTGRERLAAGATVLWLVLAVGALLAPAPWPELGFAALAVIGWGDVGRWGYAKAPAVGATRGRTQKVVHAGVFALLSCVLLLSVPVGPSTHDTPRPPPRPVVLPYLAPAWMPLAEAEEQWYDRFAVSYELSVPGDPVDVTRVWAMSVDGDGPERRRLATSARVVIAVAAQPVGAGAVRRAVDQERDLALDPGAATPVLDLPPGWEGIVVDSGTSRRVVAIGRLDNVVVEVTSSASSPSPDHAAVPADVRDLARRLAARGAVQVAADTDPLR